jgi:putative nucleotidyltransferase with HDIG domain
MAGGPVLNLQGRLNDIAELAALPSSLVRVLTIVEDEASTALELAAEISRDPALTMKVLRSVNSGYYGLARRIMTVTDAVVMLGFTEVERIALAISVINVFGTSKEHMQMLRMLWRHSLACSVAAHVIERYFILSQPEIRGAHVAALLHDIGKAIVFQYFPEAVEPVYRLASETSLPVWQAEREVMGMSHCEIGAHVAEKWKLPSALIACIAHHHAPEEADCAHAMVHATHVADEVCNSLGIQASSINHKAEVSPASRDALRIDHPMIEEIRSHIDRSRGLLSAVAAGALS